jgi:transcriptional regulator with XRE-family HTH domain
VVQSAALRRRLTAELRRLRAEAKLTQRQVADRLDWSPSKVIRIEQGTVRIGVTDLQALLNLYEVTDPTTIADLTTMARESKKLPFAEYRDVLSIEAVRYFQYEANASTIRQVTPTLVPGLLQIEEYSRALLEAYGTPVDRIERLIESRKERQELFDRAEPPEAFFILDEAALRRAVGGRQVMSRQIDHLIRMSRLPNVSVQALPFTVGAYPALDGPFVVLEFAQASDPDIVFIESTLGDTLSRDDDVEIISGYRERFWRAEDLATPPDEFEHLARNLN